MESFRRSPSASPRRNSSGSTASDGTAANSHRSSLVEAAEEEEAQQLMDRVVQMINDIQDQTQRQRMVERLGLSLASSAPIPRLFYAALSYLLCPSWTLV